MDEHIPEGYLVYFTEAAFISPDNIILPGMIGITLTDQWGICTPGISTKIHVVGSHEDQSYGYPNEWFGILDDEPDEEMAGTAFYLYENAFDIFEEHFGYTGFIRLKNKFLTQEQALKRYESALDKFRSLLNSPNALEEHEKDIRGQIKHIRRILTAFHTHTNHDAPYRLSELCGEALSQKSYTDKLIEELAAFSTIAQTFDERIETQEDRMNRAHKDGTIQKESFPIPGTEGGGKL